MQNMNKPFKAFQYTSTPEFFQDYYEYIKSIDKTFSFSKIARLCSFRSRTEVRNLIKGLKRFSKESIKKLSKAFYMSQKEEEYLILLSNFEKIDTNIEAQELFKKLTKIQQEENQVEAFKEIEITTSVLHMTLLSLFDLEDAPSDPKEISSVLKSKYTIEEISKSIEELQSFGFIKMDNSKWVGQQKFIKNYDFKKNIFLQNFHQECLDVAKDSLINEGTSERYLVGASFCINSKVFPRIIQKMNTFIENLMMLEGVAGESDTVIQFNQQLIRMTKRNINSKLVAGSEPVECLPQ